MNDLDTAQSLLGDSITNYKKVLGNDVPIVSALVMKFETDLNKQQANGCLFTFANNQFNTDRTVVTTTKDEWNFTQYIPTVDISKDFNQAVVSVSTPLPIQVNQNGKATTVMQLSCKVYYDTVTVSVQQAGQNIVQAILGKTLDGQYGGNRKCQFIYTANGDPIGTKVIEFNI